MSEFLQSQKATDDQIDLLQIGLNALDGEGFAKNSALFHIIGSVAFRGFQSSGFVEGGTSRLPEAMAKELQDQITFDAPVCAIESHGSSYRIFYGEEGDWKTLDCEHVIVAVPYSVLRKISITPPLPLEKKAAVDGLKNTSVTRTFLQFERRVWEDMGLNGQADTDQSIMAIFPGEPRQDTKRGILESYTAGEAARALAARPEEERIHLTLEGVEGLLPGISEFFEAGLTFSWDDDPFAQGAYAYYAKGEMAKFYPQVAKPVGRMFFAGDHTTPQPGWMDSAIRSGERAARQVLG
jgi:monoamine oxidase